VAINTSDVTFSADLVQTNQKAQSVPSFGWLDGMLRVVIQAVISLDSSLHFEALFKHSVTVRLLNWILCIRQPLNAQNVSTKFHSEVSNSYQWTINLLFVPDDHWFFYSRFWIFVLYVTFTLSFCIALDPPNHNLTRNKAHILPPCQACKSLVESFKKASTFLEKILWSKELICILYTGNGEDF
jgi:hypothetical protein